MSEYIKVTDVAKLIRKALKEAFPGTKFSVRSDSYAGGASINISYTDGPAKVHVEAVTNKFKGAYFDGMIDYKGSVYHTLDGKPVHFMSDFIFVSRDYSDEFISRSIDIINRRFPEGPELTLEAFRNGKTWNLETEGGIDLDRALREDLYRRTRVIPKHSPTLDRISVTGDDGYGAGTVGPDGSGATTAMGYPS